MSYKDHPKEYWDRAIEEIEKKQYFKDEAKDKYRDGKIKDGEIFIIKGAETEKEKSLWVVAVFMAGKMLYAKFASNDKRLETLKMKAVYRLMDDVKKGWADTRQAPWLPPRFQSLKNSNHVIYGAKSNSDIESTVGSLKTSDKRIEKNASEIVDEVKDIKPIIEPV